MFSLFLWPLVFLLNKRDIVSMFCLQGNLILSDIGLAEKRIYHSALNGNKLYLINPIKSF